MDSMTTPGLTVNSTRYETITRTYPSRRTFAHHAAMLTSQGWEVVSVVPSTTGRVPNVLPLLGRLAARLGMGEPRLVVTYRRSLDAG